MSDNIPFLRMHATCAFSARTRFVAAACLSGFMLAASPNLTLESHAQAANGIPGAVAPGTERAFAASYRLSDIVLDDPSGHPDPHSGVHFTMTLTLQNPSNRDVDGGIVALFTTPRSPSPSRRPVLLASFPVVASLPRLQSVTVKRSISITAAEYACWQSGHGPVFQFLVPSKDAYGENAAIAEGILAHREPSPDEAP